MPINSLYFAAMENLVETLNDTFAGEAPTFHCRLQRGDYVRAVAIRRREWVDRRVTHLVPRPTAGRRAGGA